MKIDFESYIDVMLALTMTVFALSISGALGFGLWVLFHLHWCPK